MADPTPLHPSDSPVQAFEERPESSESERHLPISDRTLARLRSYFCALSISAEAGRSVISSSELAARVGVKPGLVRKDLCRFGGFGRPSVGYNITYLHKKLGEILHVNDFNRIAWVGTRRLVEETALLRRLSENNYSVAAAFDPDLRTVKTEVGDMDVFDPCSIARTVSELELRAAVIAGGDGIDPQSAADALVAGGVRAILNLTQTFIEVPHGVSVRNIDIMGEIMLLSYHCGEPAQEPDEHDIMPKDNGSSEDA